MAPPFSSKTVTVLLFFLLVASLPSRGWEPTLVVQTGHNRPVERCRFSPDGAWLATSGGETKLWNVASGRVVLELDGAVGDFSPDGSRLALARGTTVELVETSTGRSLSTLPGHLSPVRRVRFSSDGKLLLTAGEFWRNPDRAARLWDPGTGSLLAVLDGHAQDVHDLAFQPGGSLAVTAAGNSVRLWEVPSGRLQAELEGVPAQVERLAFSPDGRLLAAACWDGTVALWRCEDGRPAGRLTGHEGPVMDLAFHPKLPLLATAGRDDTARLWDLESGRPPVVLRGHEGFVESLGFSADGGLLATGSQDGTVRTWEVRSGRLVQVLDLDAGGVRALAVSPVDQVVAAGFDGGEAAWWEATTGQLRQRLKAEAAEVGEALFGPQGRLLAVASRDKRLRLWSLVEGRMVVSAPGSVMAMAFNPQGTLLAAALSDRSLHVWDTASGEEVAVHPPGREEVRSLAFRPDGSLVAADGVGQAEIREARTGRVVEQVQGDWGWVLDMNLSPEGSILATASGDHSFSLWSMDDGRQLVKVPNLGTYGRDPRFSPDGKWLAVGTEAGVLVWSLQDGKLVELAQEGPVSALAFDPGSKLLATGNRQGTVSLWKLESASLVAAAEGHRGDVWTLGFGPGGRVLVSAGTDGLIRFCRVPDLQLLATVLAPDEEGNWLATTPQGYFDGTPAGWKRVVWRLSGIHEVAEPEQLFRDFYQPGLLAEILAEGRPLELLLEERGDPRARLDLESIDRRLPQVSLRALPARSDGPLDVTLDLAAAPPGDGHAQGSGLRDVRLLLNGVMVRRWLGPQQDGPLVARQVPLLAGENRFTAYAFNRDGVKSKDAPEVVVIGEDSLARAGRARLLAIGIDRYSDPHFDLRFAEADARATAEALGQSLARFHDGVEVRTLLSEEATREGILEALRRLVEESRPEDTVVVSYSGHGVHHQGRYYLVPYDLPRNLGVSDRELEELFADLPARRICLILDACQSGGALESDEWRQGPMNARGLAQLAYDKGMEIITASQTQEAALEAWTAGDRVLGHGLLSFALVEEGLTEAPRRSGALLVSDWLDYAARRVPRLLSDGENTARAVILEVDGGTVRTVQTPRVFHRRHDALPWPVASDRG